MWDNSVLLNRSVTEHCGFSAKVARKGGLLGTSESLSALLPVLVLQFVLFPCNGQDDAYPRNPKISPATIQSQLLVIGAQVVDAQWSTTTDLVNAPADLSQIEPGQCLSVVVIATGDGREALLQDSRFSFEIEFAGKTDQFQTGKARLIRALKLDGGDFVTDALGVAGIKNPFPSLAMAGVSEARWCAPPGARDGIVTIKGRSISNGGQPVMFATRAVPVKTFDSARRKPPFKNAQEVGVWIRRYHFAPDPALLLPALRIAAADEKMRAMPPMSVFFVAALKAFPSAAEELRQRLGKEEHSVLAYSLPLLSEAGYDTADLLTKLSASEATSVRATRLANAFDPTPNEGLMSRLDMLWATFSATGEIAPVRSVVGFLAWRDDFKALKRLIDSGQQPSELNESVMRAVIYRGAGWSLRSQMRYDGLVADYVDFIKASAQTSPAIKEELAGLKTNPAFDMQSWGAKSPDAALSGTSAPAPKSQLEPPKVAVRVEFLNPTHSRLAIETRIGQNQCARNPVLHTQALNGDADWVLTVFADRHEGLCYRVRRLDKGAWGAWHEVSRHADGQSEVYQVSLP